MSGLSLFNSVPADAIETLFDQPCLFRQISESTESEKKQSGSM